MRKFYSFVLAMLLGLTANAAADYTFSASTTPDFSDYVVDQTYFDGTEIAQKLGLADTVALKELINTGTAFYLQLPDGSRTNEGFSDMNQPWMTAAGDTVAWGGAGICWFAGIAWDTDENGVPGVNAWVGDLPGYFKTIYEPSDLSATFYLVNGDKEVSFEFKLHVDAAEMLQKNLKDLTIVKTLNGTLNFTEGGQYEGKTYELDASEFVEALALDTAAANFDIANIVLTQSVYHDPESSEDMITDTLDLPSNLSSGAWFGRYQDLTSENPDATLPQNAPMTWGTGCTYYLQNPALAEGKFTLTYGQYPGTLKPGAIDYADLYICNGNNAVKLTLTVNVEAQPDAPFSEWEMVDSICITKEQYPTTDYSTSSFAIDVDAAAEKLGVASTEVTLLALKDANNLYTSAGTANNGGWWFNKSGYVCSWGSGTSGSYFFIEPATSGDYSAMNIGQYPGDYAIGDSAVTDLFLCAGQKFVKYHIVLNIIEKPTIDPNTRTLAGNRTITVKNEVNSGYVWSSAAQITSDDLYNLIGTTDPTLYGEAVDDDGNVTWDDSYTMGEKPGFWMSGDGYTHAWASATDSPWGMTCNSGTTGVTDGIGFACMQFPGNGVEGNSYKGIFYLLNPDNNKYIKVTLINKVVAEGAITEEEVVGEEDITLPVTCDGETVEYDINKVCEALGVSYDDLCNASCMHGATGAAGEPGNGIAFDYKGMVVESAEDNNNFSFNVDSETELFIQNNSDEEVADDWSVAADVYFEINSKQYILHVKFVSKALYQEYLDGVSSVKAAGKTASIFDLSGRRVNKALKGIYIQNGQKVQK